MTRSTYIEDIFVDFFDLCSGSKGIIQPKDFSPCQNFYDHILQGSSLTPNQGNYLLKILSKYKTVVKKFGLDFDDLVENPVWKQPFRIVDLTRKVFVEQTETGINICLKFPYALKNTFEKDIDNQKNSTASKWDHDRKLRVLNLYHFNVVQIYEFCQEHNFDIDESFMDVLGNVEEVWNNQDTIIPYSVLENNSVSLKNYSDNALTFFEENKTGNVPADMFLAKSMGYPVRLEKSPKTHLDKICVSEEKMFWIKSFAEFFDVYKNVNGVVAILLDRNTKEIHQWIEEFVKASKSHVEPDTIKVCFREEAHQGSKFNDWVKEQGLGGKVDTGKILIFQHKPPKWLFSKNIDVKIIVTNSYTPHNEPISLAWIAGHPCVCYVGEIKPTLARNKKIVDL